MPQILARVGMVVALFAPALAFAAYNDVALTTGTVVISVAGVSINVTGTSASLETIAVDTNNFIATLQSGSTMTLSAPNLSITTEPAVGGVTSSCSSGVDTVTVPAVSGAVTITVVPSSTACDTTTTSSSANGGGPIGLVGTTNGGGGGGGGSYTPPTAPVIPSQATQAGSPSQSAQTAKFAALTKALAKGSKGASVQVLQQMLNNDPDTRVSLSGAGSPGKETTLFGNATLSAIKKFQVKWGIAKAGDAGYGNLGPKTRAKLNELYGK